MSVCGFWVGGGGGGRDSKSQCSSSISCDPWYAIFRIYTAIVPTRARMYIAVYTLKMNACNFRPNMWPSSWMQTQRLDNLRV